MEDDGRVCTIRGIDFLVCILAWDQKGFGQCGNFCTSIMLQFVCLWALIAEVT
jgi:hypothetical protein